MDNETRCRCGHYKTNHRMRQDESCLIAGCGCRQYVAVPTIYDELWPAASRAPRTPWEPGRLVPAGKVSTYENDYGLFIVDAPGVNVEEFDKKVADAYTKHKHLPNTVSGIMRLS